jgi:WD40 repeat protein
MIDSLRRHGIRTVASICAAFAAVAAHGEPYFQSGDQPYVEFFLNQSRDGSRVLKRSETNNYNVEVWDPHAKKLLSSITGLSGVVNVANISPDGRKVVTAERRGIVGLWDAETGKEIKLLHGHEDQIHDARFSPDGKMIASGARDGTARTWDTETGAQIAVHKQKGGNYVDTVSFSPDGQWVLSAGNGSAEVWNANSGAEHFSKLIGPEGEGGYTTDARFTPDGKSIIVMDDEGKPSTTIPMQLPAE